MKHILIGSFGLLALLLLFLTLFSLFNSTFHTTHPPITHIMQTGPQSSHLPTGYIAQLLDLSVDRPVRADQLDLDQIKSTLTQLPQIKRVDRVAVQGDTLYLVYTLRQPKIWIYDWVNYVTDRSGSPFPFAPFYPPKKLPSVYFGLESPTVEPLPAHSVALAFTLLDRLQSLPLPRGHFPTLIDLSRVRQLPHLGAVGEIVLVWEREGGGVDLLRLKAQHFRKGLERYGQLCRCERRPPLFPEEADRSVVIDLKASQAAFIGPVH